MNDVEMEIAMAVFVSYAQLAAAITLATLLGIVVIAIVWEAVGLNNEKD